MTKGDDSGWDDAGMRERGRGGGARCEVMVSGNARKLSKVVGPARYAASMEVGSIEGRRDLRGDASGAKVGVVN